MSVENQVPKREKIVDGIWGWHSLFYLQQKVDRGRTRNVGIIRDRNKSSYW